MSPVIAAKKARHEAATGTDQVEYLKIPKHIYLNTLMFQHTNCIQ